ncbi:phage tail domain-containing protein [Streptomyces pseudogriseolus]|uniref:phage tail domain-containing protein n=1 Tax=Streptomyces pseudogriseolus TaxID=36817 RepID=UPI003FA27A40
MPIPVRARPAAPVVIRPQPPAPVQWGRTNVTVTGNNGQGEEIPLTVFSGREWPAIIMQPGATGLDMPPFALFSDDSPNLDGSIYRSARAASREVMIPVYLYGVDRQTINGLKRKLFQALNPKRGYCVLKFTEGNGRTRYLTCYYKGGMEGSESTDTAGFTYAKYGLTFTAMDPWFYQDRFETITWNFGEGEPLLSTTAAFFPMRIANGVMGRPGENLTISNPGDIEAWPIWHLHGPIKSFTLTSSNGETIKGNAPSDGSDLVTADRVLTIDTRPGKKTVKDDQGTNYWAKLATNPQFWSVEPGDNEAQVSVVTGSGRAAVVLTYQPRYASYI